MADNTEDMTAEEFQEQIAEIETEDEEMFEEGEGDQPELMTFSELLDLRDDITEVNDQLDQTGGYYAQAALILEEQARAAVEADEDEKSGALNETAEKARAVAERIDGGEALEDLEEQVEAAEAE